MESQTDVLENGKSNRRFVMNLLITMGTISILFSFSFCVGYLEIFLQNYIIYPEFPEKLANTKISSKV